MGTQLDTIIEIGRAVLAVARNDRITFLAASIAFYAFLSIFPLLLLILAVGSTVGGPDFAATIVSFAAEILTPQARTILTEDLLTGTGRGSAGVVGLLALSWGSLKVFRGLDIAFDLIYGTPEEPSLVVRLLHAIVVLTAIGAGLVAIFVLRVAIQFVGISPIWQQLSILPLFVGLAIVFFPMFAVFPRPHHGPRGAVPGTLFAAGGWALLGEVFAIYAANVSTLALFGVIGGVFLFLTWLYFGAVLILVGASLNAVLARRHDGPSERADAEG